MKKAGDKTFEILYETEKTADKILFNKKAITELSQQKEDIREAIREINKLEQGNVWITVASMMVKTTKESGLNLLKKDQQALEEDINRLRAENKTLVKKHRDLEQNTPLKGFDLKPLSSKETAAIRSNLPYF